MPSPIEMMVDQACGYVESKKRATMSDDFPQLLLAIADTAEDWYKTMYYVGEHRLTESEKPLYYAVKAWLEAGGGKGNE